MAAAAHSAASLLADNGEGTERVAAEYAENSSNALSQTNAVGSRTGGTKAGTPARSKVSSIDAFYEAYSCLSPASDELLKKGIKCALDLQRVS